MHGPPNYTDLDELNRRLQLRSVVISFIIAVVGVFLLHSIEHKNISIVLIAMALTVSAALIVPQWRNKLWSALTTVLLLPASLLALVATIILGFGFLTNSMMSYSQMFDYASTIQAPGVTAGLIIVFVFPIIFVLVGTSFFVRTAISKRILIALLISGILVLLLILKNQVPTLRKYSYHGMLFLYYSSMIVNAIVINLYINYELKQTTSRNLVE